MRIVQAQCGPIGGKLPASVGNAHTRWTERRGILLVLHDDMGHLGLGEASPLPGYSSESFEECEQVLNAAIGIVQSSPGADAFSQLNHMWVRAGGVSAASFAIQTALMDLIGQTYGESLGTVASGSTPRTSVPRCGLVDGPPESWNETAARLRERGIRAFKVKVGRAGAAAQELSVLRSLRAAIGDDATLRLDANGAWSLDEARDRLTELAELRVEFVEQPVPPEQLADLGACPTPWAADESLRSVAEARRLQGSACAAFVLKPAALGGPAGCHRLAAGAASSKIGGVASHLFDGPIALAACCELALGLPGPVLACGVDTHDALAAYPSIEVPQLRNPGEIVPALHPGLGFSADARREIASWIH
jgi:o-succinylbenzoate synthase